MVKKFSCIYQFIFVISIITKYNFGFLGLQWKAEKTLAKWMDRKWNFMKGHHFYWTTERDEDKQIKRRAYIKDNNRLQDVSIQNKPINGKISDDGGSFLGNNQSEQNKYRDKYNPYNNREFIYNKNKHQGENNLNMRQFIDYKNNQQHELNPFKSKECVDYKNKDENDLEYYENNYEDYNKPKNRQKEDGERFASTGAGMGHKGISRENAYIKENPKYNTSP